VTEFSDLCDLLLSFFLSLGILTILKIFFSFFLEFVVKISLVGDLEHSFSLSKN
jgi:hypothetical protein